MEIFPSPSSQCMCLGLVIMVKWFQLEDGTNLLLVCTWIRILHHFFFCKVFMKSSLAGVTIWLVMISSCCPIQLNFPQTSVLVQPQATSHAVSLVPVTFLTFLCVVPVPQLGYNSLHSAINFHFHRWGECNPLPHIHCITYLSVTYLCNITFFGVSRMENMRRFILTATLVFLYWALYICGLQILNSNVIINWKLLLLHNYSATVLTFKQLGWYLNFSIWLMKNMCMIWTEKR